MSCSHSDTNDCKDCDVSGWLNSSVWGTVTRCPTLLSEMRNKKLKEKFPLIRGDLRTVAVNFTKKPEAMISAESWIESPSPHLFIVSPDYGVGKTHIALHLLLKFKGPVEAYTAVEFFQALSMCFSADRKEPQLIDFSDLYRVKNLCLLIDDVGKEKRTEANVSQFHTFLSSFNGKIIFTSNVWPDKWDFTASIQSRLTLRDRIIISILNAENQREKSTK